MQPRKIRVPECAKNQYYIVNDTNHVRPYGLVVRFLTNAEAKKIFEDNNYDFEPAIPFVACEPTALAESMSSMKLK